MEFRILGPLEVIDGSRTVALGGSKQRALLAILLLRANEVISRDRLIEDLWGEQAPETASTSLHGYISQLRKVLEPRRGEVDHQLLITRPPGYLLRVDPEQFDLRRFERLVGEAKGELAEGDAQAAFSTLAEALALWRGPPLAELGSASFASVESLRLQELRLSALEERIQAELALGRHADIVGELEALVAEHPLRERLQGQLMLALYRSGRQAEALETYRRSRQALVEELGIEPGIELQQLEKAILNHDRSLELSGGTARAEPDQTGAIGMQARARRPAARWLAIGVALVALLVVALGLTFALRGGKSPATMLEPNSVGFIDSASDRVTRSYPVGREPLALALAFHSVWVANYRDETVTRIDRTTGRSVFIDVRAHPTGLATLGGTLWVWTIEGLLVPIDPRFDRAAAPIDLRAQASQGRAPREMATGGGFLWMTAPETTVVRVNPKRPQHSLPIVPDAGAHGAIAFEDGNAWVAGANQVVPIAARTGIPGSGITVGSPVLDLALAPGDLWVISGAPVAATTQEALRRIDLRDRLVSTTISVGSDPVAVAAAGASIWAASGSDGTVDRVDPARERVVDTIQIGATPTTLAADEDGVWVAVR
jgi:DNA-binding SARP family transcriptional activator/DNA-binding beta-propeller fold protein YncE